MNLVELVNSKEKIKITEEEHQKLMAVAVYELQYAFFNNFRLDKDLEDKFFRVSQGWLPDNVEVE